MIHANVPLVYKNIHIWFVKPASFESPKLHFATPKLHFATTFGVATHSLRSPGINNVHGCAPLALSAKTRAAFEKMVKRSQYSASEKWDDITLFFISLLRKFLRFLHQNNRRWKSSYWKGFLHQHLSLLQVTGPQAGDNRAICPSPENVSWFCNHARANVFNPTARFLLYTVKQGRSVHECLLSLNKGWWIQTFRSTLKS